MKFQLLLSYKDVAFESVAIPRLRSKRVSLFVLLTGFFWLFVANEAWCEEVINTDNSNGYTEKLSQLILKAKSSKATRNIRQLSEIEHPAKSAELLVQTPAAEIVQVTEVKANPTDKGLEVILQTPVGQQLQITNRSAGNNFIADIPNAQLRLPSGDAFTFRSTKPIAGITEITVINIDANTIRVTVTGEANVPVVELYDSPQEGLIFSVATAASSTQQQQQPQTPDQVKPANQTDKPSTSADEAIELVVTGEQDGYLVPEASTATKIEAPLRDIPASIQVIPRQVIEDRQVVRLNELANNVSGVQLQSGYGGLSSQGYFIRGFESGFSTLRNGFRDFGFLSPRDVANVEQVEFLKGPASVLYGSTQNPGGAVNTITKKPLPEPFYRANLTIGSYDFYRPSIDFTGPLTDSKSLLYRLNVAYENANSFRDFVENESIFVAPALTWNIGPRTTLTTEFEYQNYDYTFDRGLPPSKVFFDVPISRFLGEPDFNRAEYDSFSGTYNFEHKFSDNWRFRQGFNVISVSGNIQNVRNSRFSEPFLAEDGRTLLREAEKTDESQENYTLQNEIYGKFNTGSIRHNFLFGVELARYKFAYDFFDAGITGLDIFNPVYGAKPGTFDPSFAEEYGADNVAVYVQDLIELLPNLKLLAGGRFDWVDSSYRDTLTNAFEYETSDSKFSPRVGIVYQPSDSTSLYASWTKSFNPLIFGRSRSGQPFEPETGEQFEVGIKQEFFDKRLSATLAYFDITKQNVQTPDPVDPDNFSIQTGEQKSRGVELDIRGEILPGWQVIATYAYTDAFVSQDNDRDLVDDQLQAVPKHSASLWTTYEIQSGSLQGLGFGAGLVFVDEREATLPNTIKISSYVRADASIFYRRNNWRTALNFKNLFDTDYYESQRFYLVPGAPLTLLGTLSVEF